MDVARILDRRIILELDALTNADKTFLIESFLLWIHHYRLAQPQREEFKHAIVIEEAHHILLRKKQEATGEEAVQIRQLDFCLRRDRSKRVVLSASPTRREPEPVWQLLEHVTVRNELSLEKLDITRVKLRLVFAADEKGRRKTLTFEVASPDRCTLRDEHYDQVARKCLKRWGVHYA